MPAEFKYIRKLKDIKVINLTGNKNENSHYPFVCPII